MTKRTLVIDEVVSPDGTSYWALFDMTTGQKVAPWSDADTPEGVLEALVRRTA